MVEGKVTQGSKEGEHQQPGRVTLPPPSTAIDNDLLQGDKSLGVVLVLRGGSQLPCDSTIPRV